MFRTSSSQRDATAKRDRRKATARTEDIPSFFFTLSLPQRRFVRSYSDLRWFGRHELMDKVVFCGEVVQSVESVQFLDFSLGLFVETNLLVSRLTWYSTVEH